MQTIDPNSLVEGIFIHELKNRFLCEVSINEVPTTCYVPSSCHLSNFLQLQGKRVLLIKNSSSTSRTMYALFAVPYKKNYIVSPAQLHFLKQLQNQPHSASFESPFGAS